MKNNIIWKQEKNIEQIKGETNEEYTIRFKQLSI